MTIDHIALYANDLEAMKAFFIRFFGARSGDGYHNPRTGLRTWFLSFDDGTRLEIMHRPGLAVPDDVAERIGYVHLAFRVGGKLQVDGLTSRLQEAGYPVVSAPRTTGDGYYESCVSGPEGIRIEITE